MWMSEIPERSKDQIGFAMQPTPTYVNNLAHTKVEECYQCGKCTAGCPVAERMDLTPNQLVRLAQTAQFERALRCEAIWMCVSCQTCTTRCPKSVNCAGVMDALRQCAVEQAEDAPAQMRTVQFFKAFLQSVRRNGRVNEVEMTVLFKSAAFFKDLNIPMLMKDSMLAPKLFARGKFHVVGEKVRDRALVDRIFERCMKADLYPASSSEGHSH